MFPLNFKETFPCPPEVFLKRALCEFDEYAKFAPNVSRVDVLTREALPEGREEIAVRVFARGWLPPAARAILNVNEVNWKERYLVDLPNLKVDWRVETPMFSEYVNCGGTSSARAVSGGCEVTVKGSLSIGTPALPGVPEPILRAAAAALEPFIGRLTMLNLRKYFTNVRRCMEREARSTHSG